MSDFKLCRFPLPASRINEHGCRFHWRFLQILQICGCNQLVGIFSVGLRYVGASFYPRLSRSGDNVLGSVLFLVNNVFGSAAVYVSDIFYAVCFVKFLLLLFSSTHQLQASLW